MNEALQVLLTDGVIDEVVGRLKSGKEADVYLVRHGGEVVAAKIYKEREHRNFRNNSGYREGRQVRNSRTARAIAKGSRFGVAAAEDAWKTAEVEALFKLHAAGVCVPRPVMFYEGVLLMELVLDLEGHPAPRLEEAPLTPEEASALYFDLRNQAIRMLCCDLIHGDLSAFNILLGNRGATIIDLPQVVDAAANSQAEFFFKRDVENLRRYFESVDPGLRARAGDALEIWRAYVKRELTPDFVPTGRVQAEAPRERRFSGGGPRGGGGEPRGAGPRGPGGNTPPGNRPQGDRPPANRAQGDRPPANRAQGDRPPGNRAQGDRPPGNRPQGDRPPANRAQGDRPPGDRPARREAEGSRPWREPRDTRSGPPREQGPRQGPPPQQGPRQGPPRDPSGFREQRPPRGERPPRENQATQAPRGRPMDRRAPSRGETPPQVSYVRKPEDES